MKRIKTTIVILLIILIIPNYIVLAADTNDTNPKASMLPSITELYNYKSNKYFSVYKDNYYLDMQNTGIFSGWGGKTFNMIANVLFGLEVIVAQLVVVIIYYAFEISFFDIFSPVMTSVVQNLQVGIFNDLALVCIASIGIFYIISMLKNQKTEVWKALIKMIVILAIALSFFRAPVAMLKGVDDLSKGIGQAALEGTFKATNNGATASSGTEAITTNIWMMFVHKPWEAFEFGNTDFAEKNEDKILRLQPESDARQKIIDDIAKDKVHFQPSMGLIRLGLTLIYLVIFLIIGIMIVILCALMMGYQFLMILFAMFAPLVFLIALLPHFGFNTLKSWGGKIIGYGSMKAVMSLIIAIVFSFMLALYQLSDKYGLVLIGLFMVICLGMIWFKREELFDFYVKFATASRQPSPAVINKTIRKDVNLENGFRDFVRKRRNNENTYEPNDTGQSKEDNEGNDTSRTEYDRNYGAYGNRIKRNDSHSYPHSKKEYGEAYDHLKADEISAEQKHYENAAGMGEINSNLNSILKISEEILEDRYEKSKTKSDLIADRTGNEPKYSNWVKRVKSREEMNLPKFEEREKVAVAKEIQEITRRGGNVEELIDRDNLLSAGEAKRPLGVVQTETEPIKFKIENEPTLSDGEASETFVQDFNKEYGKNYSPKFMGNLIDNYGQNNVNNVLKEMQKINAKNEKIHNPAGYLTESLKNNSINDADFRHHDFESNRTEQNPIIYDSELSTKNSESNNEGVQRYVAYDSEYSSPEKIKNQDKTPTHTLSQSSAPYELNQMGGELEHDHNEQNENKPIIYDSEYSKEEMKNDFDDEKIERQSTKNSESNNEGVQRYVAYDSEFSSSEKKNKKQKEKIKNQDNIPTHTLPKSPAPYELNLRGGELEYDHNEQTAGTENKVRIHEEK